MNEYFKTTLIFLLTGMLLTLFNVGEALSIPAFAKKYNKRCSLCHAAVPKLNALGERYRLNGYQFPGTMDETPLWHQEAHTILSLMVHGMYNNMTMKNNTSMTMNGVPANDKVTISDFEVSTLEFLSGGTLGKNLSYFAFFEIEKEGELQSDGTWQTETSTSLKELFGIYNNVGGGNTGNLNLRFGLFEMEIPFSSIRALGSSHSVPYLVYSASPSGFRLDLPQSGISAYGLLPFGLLYEAAVVNGSNADFDGNDEKDFYFRLAQSVGNHRIGGFYYNGTSNLNTYVNELNEKFSRYGADVSANFLLGDMHVNLIGQYLVGKDDIAGAGGGHHKPTVSNSEYLFQGSMPAGFNEFEYSGYFVEADISIIPHKLITMVRYESLKVNEQAAMFSEDNVTRIVGQLRYYFQPNFFTVLQYHTQDNMLGTMSDSYGVMDMDMDMLMAMFAIAW